MKSEDLDSETMQLWGQLNGKKELVLLPQALKVVTANVIPRVVTLLDINKILTLSDCNSCIFVYYIAVNVSKIFTENVDAVCPHSQLIADQNSQIRYQNQEIAFMCITCQILIFKIHRMLPHYGRKMLAPRIPENTLDRDAYNFYYKIFRDISDLLNPMRNVLEQISKIPFVNCWKF